jgi:hypothetical protein
VINIDAMNLGELRHASHTVGLLALLALGTCTNEVPVHTCVVQEDCPASLSCLQGICEASTLPNVELLSPEDGMVYAWMDDGTVHTEILNIAATDLILRPKAESSERVLGEGYLVVFVDEIEVATIDSGDLGGGVQIEITFEDSPGVHRLRVQARLNDGTDYDNLEGSARTLIWVDDGLEHVALRRPWPGDAFSLEQQLVEIEVAVMDGSAITLAPPGSGEQHVKIYEDAEPFELCVTDPMCLYPYIAIVPSSDDEFGPALLHESDAGTASLTAVVMNDDHTPYTYTDGMGMERYVYSSIEILRTDEVAAGD